MVLRSFVLALTLAPALLFGQTSSNSVTVTATQNVSLPADQATFGVFVNAGIDKGFDDILSTVQGSGLTAANFTGISTSSVGQWFVQAQPTLQWAFQLPTPVSKIKDTTVMLTALQQKLVTAGGGLSLSFSVQGTQVSAQAQPSQACDLAALIADARTQAQKLAAPAGLSPGAILGITGSTSSSLPSPCSLTVRFALGTTSGPTGPNTVTIAALRSITVLPDQALFSVSVDSGLNAGLDDVTAVLAGAGITGTSFSSVYTSTYYVGNGQPQAVLQWSFTLTAPFSKIKDTLTLLAAAQQAVEKQNAGMHLTFSVLGTQVSPELQKSQSCPQADLLADAQAQAQKVAAAAGASAGTILNISSGNSLGTGISAAAIFDPYTAVPVLRSGAFTSTTGLASFVLGGITTSSGYSCSLSVQFLLLQN